MGNGVGALHMFIYFSRARYIGNNIIKSSRNLNFKRKIATINNSIKFNLTLNTIKFVDKTKFIQKNLILFEFILFLCIYKRVRALLSLYF